MNIAWRMLVVGLCVYALCSCASKEPQAVVHKEVMVVKKGGAEEKKEVRDPLNQGVPDDSPIIKYTPE